MYKAERSNGEEEKQFGQEGKELGNQMLHISIVDIDTDDWSLKL